MITFFKNRKRRGGNLAGSLVEKKTERNDKIYEILCSIVGSRRVSTDPEELYLYSWSFVNATDKPGRCDYVVMPETVEEVQQIVKTANIYKICLLYTSPSPRD